MPAAMGTAESEFLRAPVATTLREAWCVRPEATLAGLWFLPALDGGRRPRVTSRLVQADCEAGIALGPECPDSTKTYLSTVVERRV
jgi:hypothetical protein